MDSSKNKNTKNLRLKYYDYSNPGAYFTTICTQDRNIGFGEVRDTIIYLNDAGEMVRDRFSALSKRFNWVEVDEFIVMPDHLHGIIVIIDKPGDHKDRPYSKSFSGPMPMTLGRIIQAFKSVTTHEYISGIKHNGWQPFSKHLWQRGYYEHVIRNRDELARVREYISTNPLRWQYDRENGDGENLAWQATLSIPKKSANTGAPLRKIDIGMK
ncbi:MAG TPA: transposase [Candidatus Glassbacteria bacterium]|nr:transposase [Candidatus Glassbacteria bacterium]